MVALTSGCSRFDARRSGARDARSCERRDDVAEVSLHRPFDESATGISERGRSKGAGSLSPTSKLLFQSSVERAVRKVEDVGRPSLKPALAQPGEIEALHAKLKDLSDLLDFYGKYK